MVRVRVGVRVRVRVRVCDVSPPIPLTLTLPLIGSPGLSNKRCLLLDGVMCNSVNAVRSCTHQNRGPEVK